MRNIDSKAYIRELCRLESNMSYGLDVENQLNNFLKLINERGIKLYFSGDNAYSSLELIPVELRDKFESASLSDVLQNVSKLVVNPGIDNVLIDKTSFDRALSSSYNNPISILRCGVLDPYSEIIVNAANSTLLGGGGVDGAIHRAAGPGLLEECKGLHGCTTGNVKITKSYNLKTSDKIIHAVGPIYSGKDEDRVLLSSCYEKALDLAYVENAMSIAFPCISTGVYGYPLDKATRVVKETIEKWLRDHNDFFDMNIHLCCFTTNEYNTYKKVFEGF